MAASFLISYLFDINVVLIIIAAAIIGAVRTLLRERKGAKA